MTERTPKLPVEMGRFFDERAAIYDNHMREALADRFDPFYAAVGQALAETSGRIDILDLGCGTGVELEYILARCINSRFSCIDLSGEMTRQLKRKYSSRLAQIECIEDSFLTRPFPVDSFHSVVSVMAMHHFTYPQKLGLYRKIKFTLIQGGQFILGDHLVGPDEETRLLAEYRQRANDGQIAGDNLYHIDIPFSLSSEQRVLQEAGFSKVEVLFESPKATVLAAR